MEVAANENPENLAVSANHDAEQQYNHSVSDLSNHVGIESHQFSVEEVICTLETSASTGRFWQDWKKLKNILSYYLKQILSEYPEAKMTMDQQFTSLGETFQVLVKRLDDAIRSFDEGPPFTLQRLCEILLSARSIYPRLTKLTLALEKNLLVASMLTIYADGCPPSTEQISNGAPTDSAENGVEHTEEDKDEIMTEVEEAEVNEDMTIDMESNEEETFKSSEAANPTRATDL
ncbi:uncharacterized protein LOC142540278 isoform X2 [Primulina tabacum]|uniref:uncharacterized protein LOC142540278 isoform X2 n=1 Tax=Primulina tabacum TaxID=48773 RepID=UPI003F5A15DC